MHMPLFLNPESFGWHRRQLSYHFLFLSYLLSVHIVPCLGIILTQPSQLTTTTFDYIIVGGGTAGLVVASRLSENSSVSILVLEAGINDQDQVPLQIPFFAPTLTPNTIYDWNTSTIQQAGMLNRIIPYNRGRVLGGSSSVNFLFHQYCAADDWNRLGNVSGDPGWAWENIRKYISKHEKMVTPVDGHNTVGQFVPSTHGTTGEISVSLPGSNNSIDTRVLSTIQQLQPEFTFSPDTSGGDNSLLGIGFIQSSSGNGVRSSSSTTYLKNANTRPNLTVLVNATVIKVAQSGNSSTGAPSFRSVQFVTSPPPGNITVDTPIIVNARKEVILSAGTIGSSLLLQLSGIGNSSQINHIGTIINNPDVGNNLSDHLLIPNVFEVTGTTLDNVIRNPTTANLSMAQWLQNKTGVLANSVANNYGFFRLPANSSIFETTPDPASGSQSPHWEIIFSNVWFDPGVGIPATRSFLTIVTLVVSPTSRGTAKLRGVNPFQNLPNIDPAFLSTDFDIFAARESVKAALRFVAAPAWSDYVVGPFGSLFGNGVVNDTTIDNYVRSIGGSAFHPVGTASMSAVGATHGVVNPDLTVKGADGLRVVDASVFPFIPSCHTQGPVYLLAERASDIIKGIAT